jgi:DNA-binding phage protein
MGKTKTSIRRKKSLGNTTHKRTLRTDTGIVEFSPTKELLDEKLIAQAVWECLKDNDPEGVIEIIQIHLTARNKSQFAKDAEMARSTMYNSLKSKNPQLRTLAKFIHAYTESSPHFMQRHP